MYTIKQIPEDFVVNEISNLKFEEQGKYSYYKLTKKNYSMNNVLSKLANKLKIKINSIGFAGTKDKKALTTQMISIPNCNIKDLELTDIKLEFLGKSDLPISLGDLEANEFLITVRNLEEFPKIPKNMKLLNLFDEQRFSNNNIDVGKALIKKDFKYAINLILENKGNYEEKVDMYLLNKPNDYVGAIRQIPKKISKLFINSFQSYLWNKVALSLEDSEKNLDIPLVGFGTEFNNKTVEKAYNKLLLKEKIGLRDFIIPSLPELSSEGSSRMLFVELINIEVLEETNDELNNNKKKMKLKFKLPKASYATMVIKNLFQTAQ